jgi:hypothetical protein
MGIPDFDYAEGECQDLSEINISNEMNSDMGGEDEENQDFNTFEDKNRKSLEQVKFKFD